MKKQASTITSKKIWDSKNSKFLKVGFLSDVHLGNNLTKTDFIIANLNKHFPDNEVTGQLDMLWVTGDFFDRALMLSDPDSFAIKTWIYRLLRICKKRDIVLRVLKGTPSHDWDQCKYFEEINTNSKIGADLKYFTDISIEYNERFDMNILYVPDMCRPDTETIYQDVLKVLNEHNLKTVHAAAMHGTFDFQLPEIAHIDKHISNRYLDLVTCFIVAGHIHQPNKKKHLYIPASFDRMVHGDEGFKGWLILDCYHGEDRFKRIKAHRIENVTSKRFDTVNVRGMGLEDSIAKIEKHASSLVNQSHIRIYGDNGSPIFSRMLMFKKQFPFLIWSSKEEKLSKVDKNDILSFTRTIDLVQITKENLVQITRDKLLTLSDDAELIELCCTKLKETI